MAWAPVTVVQGVTQWSDLPNADAWFNQLVSLTSDVTVSSMDGQPFSVQAAHALSVWQALSAAFKSLNIPPLACPFYAQPSLDQQLLHRQRAMDCITQWNVGASSPVTIDADHLLCNVVQRLSLDVITGEVVSTAPHTTIAYNQTASDVLGTPHGCGRWDNDQWARVATAGGLVPGATTFDWNCDPYSWNRAAFSGGDTVIGFAAGPVCGVTTFLPPLRWFLELPRKIADTWQSLGSENFMKMCVQYAILTNIDQANKEGVTSVQLQNQTLNLPVVLAQAEAANAASARAQLAAVSGVMTGALTAIVASGAATSAAVGPYGAVVAAMFAIVAAVVAIVGAAVGVAVDPWGQTIPDPTKMTRGWVPWTIYQGTPPTATLPAPPFVVYQPSISVTFPIVPTVPSAGGVNWLLIGFLAALGYGGYRLLAPQRSSRRLNPRRRRTRR